MPRIKADNIAEHVAQQRAAVLSTAVELFTTRGFNEVTLADIAAEVGLARNSLYRYVPNKDHLLVEWYRNTIPRTVAEWEEAVDGDDAPADRIKRWARSYLAWTHTPEHRLVAPLTDAIPSLDSATRDEVAHLHRTMMGVVAGVVADADIPEDEVSGVVDLLAGITLGASRAEAATGRPDRAIRQRVDAAIDALMLKPASASPR